MRAWRNQSDHPTGQMEGRAAVFADYRIRMAQVLRDYTQNQRGEAPHDSKAALLAPCLQQGWMRRFDGERALEVTPLGRKHLTA